MRRTIQFVPVMLIVVSGCGQQKKTAHPEAEPTVAQANSSKPQNVPDPAADLYGDPVDEQAVPANQAPPFTYMRPRKGDSVFRLSNARFLPIGEKPSPQLKVDYEWVREGEFNGQSLVVNRADGRTQIFLLMYPFAEKRGTISIDLGIAPPGQTQPKDAEIYLTRNDPRWGPQSPTFKVSNSTFMGTFDESKRTPVRGWTKEEAERLSKSPPAYASPNTKDGKDTEFAGDTTGGASFRYADPSHTMIGVEYSTGSWAGTNCIASITPIFTPDQPTLGGTRVMTKSGQAVGGIEVQSKVFVTAIRLIYVDANGKESGKSVWFGYPDVEAEKKAKKLAGNGETVIGVHLKKGAILNGIALVVKE